jgi:hypothetical protein
MPARRFCCSTSAANDVLVAPAAEQIPEGVPPREVGLRNELAALKPSALRKRAVEDGVEPTKIQEAKDSDAPKDALIELIIAAAAAAAGPTPEQVRLQALRDELSGLKPSELEERALAAGVDGAKFDDAVDGDTPKETLIELILAVAPPAAEDTSSDEAATTTASAALRRRNELAALKPSALRKRAVEDGIDPIKMKEAKDSDAPKDALIELIIAAAAAGPTPEQVRLQALRDELSGLKPSELEERAHSAGVDGAKFDDAVDGDTPKETLIELILSAAREDTLQLNALHHPAHPVFRALAAQQLESCLDKLLALGVKHVQDLEELTEADIASVEMSVVDRAKFLSAFITEKPHMGTPSPQQSADAIAAGGFTFEEGMHCMLSYDWDRQDAVIEVREHFQKLGIPTCK